MSKHTPGPWGFEPMETTGGARYQHIRAGPTGVADTYHADPVTVLGHGPMAGHIPARNGNAADAQLISAAPDLLEALRGLLGLYSGEEWGGDETLEEVRGARAAISKATGGES